MEQLEEEITEYKETIRILNDDIAVLTDRLNNAKAQLRIAINKQNEGQMRGSLP